MNIVLDDKLQSYDGKDVKATNADDAEAVTVRKALEIACLSADPTKWKTGDEKYEVYSVLKKVADAEEEVEFNAKETLLLKELIGNIYGPGVVGVVYDILDPPTE